MTVKELKESIKDLPDEMEVILQKDAEGNGYSPLSSIDADCVYIAANSYQGDFYSTEWTADDCCMSNEEWEDMRKHPRSLILAPIN